MRGPALLGIVLVTAALATPGIGRAAADPPGDAPCSERILELAVIAHGFNSRTCSDATLEVRAAGVGTALPVAGEGVTVSALVPGGAEVSLDVWVDHDGTVHANVDGADGSTIDSLRELAKNSRTVNGRRTLSVQGSPLVTGSRDQTSTMSRCADTSYKLLGGKWTNGLAPYLVNSTEGLPSTVTSSQFLAHVYAAKLVWERGTNSCSLTAAPEKLNITQSGTTKENSNINGASASCASRDGLSVVDFGYIVGPLGLTCSHWNSVTHEMWEADIRISHTNVSWYQSPDRCTSAYEVRSVITHEFGHFIGISHALERGGNDLTMSPNVASCNTSGRKLGKGDLLALDAKY